MMNSNKRPFRHQQFSHQQRPSKQQDRSISCIYGVPSDDPLTGPNADPPSVRSNRVPFSRSNQAQPSNRTNGSLALVPPTTTTTTVNHTLEQKPMYTCQVCQNLDFHTQQALQEHVSSHVQCSHCSFTASKKITHAHFLSAHGKFSSGGFQQVAVNIPGFKPQLFQVCVGNDPEEIKKWIDERRKNYPTRANILRKQSTSTKSNHQDTIPSNIASSSTSCTLPKKTNNDNNSNNNNALESLMAGYYDSSSEDESPEKQDVEGNSSVTLQPTQNASPQTNCLKSSDMNNVDDTTNSSEHQKDGNTNSHRPTCRYFLSGKCKNGYQCRFLHDNAASSGTSKTKTQGHVAKRQKIKDVRNTSLLRKLLDNDIRREASLTLQLLRYIVNSNFFQPPQKILEGDK